MRRIALLIMLLSAPAWCSQALAQLSAQSSDLTPELSPMQRPSRPTTFDRRDSTEGLFAGPGVCFQWILYENPFDTTYFTAQAVAFRRDWQTSRNITTLDNQTDVVLRTRDLNFVSQPGLSLLAGRRLTDYFAVEASFVGLLNWDETRAVQNITPNSQGTLGNLFSPFSGFGNPPILGLDYNDFVSIRTVSDFNTFELNVRQRFDTLPSLMQASGLYGFRYINIHEQFQYRSESTAPPGVGSNNAVNVETHNNLYGIQAGGTVELRIEPRGWLNLEAKGLMCNNSATEETTHAIGPTQGPSVTTDSSASRSRVVFGADVAATVVWKFTPHIIGRLGYQGIFLDGLALASENFVRNAPFIPSGVTDVYRNGHLAYHGPFAGLSATW